MLNSIARLLAIAIVIALPALAGPGALWPAPAPAQDFTGLDIPCRMGIAGPYLVTAEARPLPSLQAAQVFVKVVDADTASPAPNRCSLVKDDDDDTEALAQDLRVTVHSSLRGSDETGWAHAFSPNTPGVYQATVDLKKPGVWEMTLEIGSSEEDGPSWWLEADSFVLEVEAPRSSPEAGFVFIGVALAIFAGAGYLLWRIRRIQRERAARAGVTAM